MADGRGDWTYAMVTPDGVAGGAVDIVLALTAAHGLVPGLCRPIGLNVRSMQEFYGGPTFHIQDPGRPDFEFSWATHEALYGLAPACLVMLSAPQGDACQTMLRCKGKTRPELAEPGTVRWLGENVIFNLVHSPDDAESAYRELKLLVGAEEAAWLATTPPTPHQERLAGVGALAASLPAAGGWEATSFPVIANRIRRRVVQRLALSGSGITELLRAYDLLVIESAQFRAGAASRERLAAARAVNQEISGSLDAAAAELGDEMISDGLAALSALYDLRAPRRPEAVFALADRGIYLAPLERVMVESHSYAFRPNREIDEFY